MAWIVTLLKKVNITRKPVIRLSGFLELRLRAPATLPVRLSLLSRVRAATGAAGRPLRPKTLHA